MIVGQMFREIDIYQGYKLLEGNKYVMPRSVIDQINRLFPRSINPTGEFDLVYNPVNVSNIEKGKKIFMFRSGGIGDVLFMQPLIKILSTVFEAKVSISTSPTYTSICENDPYIKNISKMPFLLSEMLEADYHLTFEGVIEDLNNERAQKNHAVDLFLETAGIDPKTIFPNEKISRIYLRDEEKMSAMKFINKQPQGKKRVGIQIAASSPVRTFPLEKFIDVATILSGEGYIVYVFGGLRQKDDAMYLREIIGLNKIVDLTNSDLSLRESIAICSEMDLVIAPDSAFIHIAGAFDIPIIGLYGCFPSLVRMKYYKNAIGLDCDVACAPSFIHGHSPCKKGSPPPCFSVITSKNIIDAVDHLLNEKHINMEYPDYNEFKEGNPIKLLEGLLDGSS